LVFVIIYLGQGKFSIVYKAERLKDQKQVALKIIKVNYKLTADL